MSERKTNFLIIIIYLPLIYIAAHKMYSFPESLFLTKVLETDGMFTQVQIQSFIDGAMLGSTGNLGFPLGYSHWLVPQFGLIDSLIIWLLGNLSSFTNYGLLTVAGIITLVLNLISMFILGLTIDRNKVTAFSFGLIGLITPFVLNSLIHIHVMKVFIIPAVFTLVIQLVKKNKINWVYFIFYSVVIFNASLYWINVFMAIFLMLILIEIIDRIFHKTELNKIIIYVKLLMFISIGFTYHIILYIYNSSLLGVGDRFPWQSDIFSGKFSDILVGSPLLNKLIPKLANILPGTSTEALENMLGIPLIIGFLIALYSILSSVNKRDTNILFIYFRQIAIVSILFFVLGGLSNLQAAFFVIIDSTSPMRNWSRLSILIAILGLVLINLTFKNSLKKNFAKFFYIILCVFALIELIFLPQLMNNKNNLFEQENYASLKFIEANLKPCPILQLPADTYLLPQGWLDNAARYYWTNMIPYVILPKFKWTAATYTDSSGWEEYISPIPSDIGRDEVMLFSKTYCAIYFDKNFSQYQIDRQASLNGLAGFWPGLRIKSELVPDFEDARYSIYLLSRN